MCQLWGCHEPACRGLGGTWLGPGLEGVGEKVLLPQQRLSWKRKWEAGGRAGTGP